jgi:glycerol-3-phosphate cytidylyltransferase
MKTIGFTSGVFDMFHIGHLNIINNAKSQCDYLIVGVNTDELTAMYKKRQPVVPYEERIKIVAAIKGVDEVIKVNTLDKEIIWKDKYFDLLFIGDDWKGSQRWNETERIMLTHNVKTVYLPYTDSTSSTMLRKKIEDGESCSIC